jgi:hypothetical protein
MAEYCKAPEEEFKQKWTRSGKLLPNTRIVQSIRNARQAAEKDFITQLKAICPEDSADFKAFFSYNSGTALMTDRRSILLRFQKLAEKQRLPAILMQLQSHAALEVA